MKYDRVIIPIALLLFINMPARAADDNLIPGDLMNYIGFGAVVFALLLIIIVLLVLLKTTLILTRIILKSEGYTEQEIAAEIKPQKAVKKAKGDVWIKLMSLRPLSEEKDLIIEHAYDGIQELDNPTPAWFMYLFYGTIFFAIGYLLNYHVFHTGQLQYEEYQTEISQADIAKKAFLSKSANRVDETTVKLVTDPAVLSSGKAIFKQNCAACHGENAQGVVGPNLTDDYWLHGGKITDLFKTIKYGVLNKGMPTWEKQLSPKQIADVANYVKSLHGTNPANPKEAQGTKETDDKLASK
ncbi:cbb3-type cytochrome c oxidase N-terminal domain-containing protein [Mucilaginibacter sp. UR6-11]|uniref:cbb3-type cytochrome c oxidase N-terminal domain-containing protein n=1 Tax=Mucilaginibacter sp. UR6-11 TaxID=1435644 RepID=UPI001E5F07FB|nr:cbb3-type cytochrome c oxidase N-terminal domain-containing protein [Mucilaginibacter sp. UR6-11]MCC8425354.1 c-type cytochrome [Mucilaginibacter sp. UR6-11]